MNNAERIVMRTRSITTVIFAVPLLLTATACETRDDPALRGAARGAAIGAAGGAALGAVTGGVGVGEGAAIGAAAGAAIGAVTANDRRYYRDGRDCYYVDRDGRRRYVDRDRC